MYISYVAENSQTKEQYHVGTITYNTVLQKWMSEISEEINSLWQLDLVLIQQGSMTRQEQVYGKKTSLQILLQVNLSVPDFEVDYEYGFEIVLNKEPALEKSADIRMITNKSLPLRLFILHLKTKTMLQTSGEAFQEIEF
jgi:hypothetical protein